MPRHKIYKILAKDTDFYALLISELRLMNPQLITEYDMESLEISHFLGITRPTLNKWIQNGFVKAVKCKNIKNEYSYTPEEILNQLLQLKNLNIC